MSRYMWGIKNNVYLFNVATSAQLIERAAQFLEKISAQNFSQPGDEVLKVYEV